jgi:hypothetical protein
MEGQEKYSEEQLKKIISTAKINEEEGGISAHIERDYLILAGYSRLNPDFISNIDGRVWREKWEEKIKDKGIDYQTNQALFFKRLEEVNYAKVVDFVNDVKELLHSHFEATNRYNEGIAKPYIEGRRKILSSLL